jgi:hypothetical protein
MELKLVSNLGSEAMNWSGIGSIRKIEIETMSLMEQDGWHRLAAISFANT